MERITLKRNEDGTYDVLDSRDLTGVFNVTMADLMCVYDELNGIILNDYYNKNEGKVIMNNIINNIGGVHGDV